MQAVEYQNADQMRAAYSERRARLWRPGPDPVSAPKARPVPIVWQPHKPMRLPVATPRPQAEHVEPAPRPRDVLKVSTPDFGAPANVLRSKWKRIVKEVADAHGVTVKAILGLDRSRKIAYARHEAMYLLKTETPLSYCEIGRRLNRDHSTVMNGIRAHLTRSGFNRENADNSQISHGPTIVSGR